ncbi:aldehyde dehydrogenase family protein [Rhodococcus sp. JS3073]|uniref:aldehyde dehydrogenase family protein n=1 Tax=Rhodococcus sp. JS3073 TaxID=3002901 RepID=UPI0022859B67|nr:aldehyde dehydrogenase family protein [Rhodococcus sp. JS3073]WAM19612.1 aldehyde dehydrogenase family protein [Rhodococcus sp. JS3073]
MTVQDSAVAERPDSVESTIAHNSGGLYIGGEWTSRSAAATTPLVAPATEQVYAHAVIPTIADADAAVAAARRAFETGTWRTTPVAERVSIINRACGLIAQRAGVIAEIAAHEMGAPVQVTRMMTGVVLDVVRGMGELARSVPDVEPGTGLWDFEIQRDPAGVVVDIVPWNSPFTATMMKSAQALLAGCSVISKPPPTAPFAVVEWARALELAGLPKGVYSVLAADPSVAEHLVAHPAVDLVVFTGGTGVGRRVAELCGRNLKRVVLELGGKSAAVVLDDADLQLAVDSVAASVYFNSGQICSALSRLVIPAHAVDDVVEMLRVKANSVIVGDPLADTTTMGPMATREHHQRVLQRVHEGREEGGRLVYGGERPPEPAQGWYVTPTLFVGDNSMSIAREEIFGPVVTILPYDHVDEAIAIANDSPYGLGGSVFSRDDERARAVAARLDTGSVTINGYTTNLLAPRDPHKDSGIGSVTGTAGYQNFRTSRLVNLRAGGRAWRPTELFADAE